jgi:hypothetical protein
MTRIPTGLREPGTRVILLYPVPGYPGTVLYPGAGTGYGHRERGAMASNGTGLRLRVPGYTVPGYRRRVVWTVIHCTVREPWLPIS